MPERTSYKPGTPSWSDLSSPNLEASSQFYRALFGWGVTKPDKDKDAIDYRMFLLDGKAVAGLGKLPTDGQPPVWATYVTVTDADETTTTVLEAGGHTLMPPMDMPGAGRMGVFADTEGAVFCIWEPKELIGAQLVNETGTLCWNELATRDPEKARAFYADVFGWAADASEGESASGKPYTEWKLDGDSVGGMMEMGDLYPEDVPPHWMTYFGVDDADAAAAKAKEHGGSVVVEPRDIQAGRIAVLADNHGSVFAVFQPKGE